MKNEKLVAQIEKSFPLPQETSPAESEALCFYAREYAEMINKLCPDSDEKEQAIVLIEQSLELAIAAINKV